MNPSELGSRLKDWVAHGLLTPQQAEEIRSFEGARARPSSVPIAGEVLGYVGGALSLAALFAITTQFWSELGTGGQIALAALVTAACLAGGWAFSAGATPQAKRLGYFLMFLGTAAFGFLSGLVADWLAVDHDVPPLVGSLGALLAGVAIWWRHRTSLQLVGVAVPLAVLVVATANLYLSSSQTVFIGFGYLVLGCLWAVSGELGWLTPRTAAWAVGSLALLVAPQILAADTWRSGGGYLILGCIISVSLMAVALWRGRVAPLGFGAAGIVIFVPQALYSLFENAIGVPIALLLAGVLLVAMSALVIRVRPRLQAGPDGRH